MIRRFASQVLYVSPECIYYRQIIELHDGIVHRFFPLTEEMPSVRWLGGVIVLSSQVEPVLKPGVNFHELIASLTFSSGEMPLYAFFLKGVNLQDHSLSAAVSLRRLE